MRMKQETNVSRRQIIVDCTARVRKRMRRNLQKAARDKVSPARAKIASALLASINTKPDVAASKIRALFNSGFCCSLIRGQHLRGGQGWDVAGGWSERWVMKKRTVAKNAAQKKAI